MCATPTAAPATRPTPCIIAAGSVVSFQCAHGEHARCRVEACACSCHKPKTPAAATVAARPTPRSKPARTLRILCRPAPGELVVEVTASDGRNMYHVFACPPFSGTGRAWIWQGLGRKTGSRYEVNMGSGSGDGQGGSCECRSRVTCRHRSATEALLARGDLS
jgi:hypothetical protein